MLLIQYSTEVISQREHFHYNYLLEWFIINGQAQNIFLCPNSIKITDWGSGDKKLPLKKCIEKTSLTELKQHNNNNNNTNINI